MARLTQGIMGGISGTIGNVVGSSWKGISVVKSKPLSVSNPQTTAQTAQRTKMTNVVDFSKEILTTIIKPLWDRFAQQASGYNDFVRANIALFDNVMPSSASDLKISSGKMQAPIINSVDPIAGNKNVQIHWSVSNPGPYQKNTDEMYSVIVNEVKEKVKGANLSSDFESEEGGVILDEAPESGDTINCYLAQQRADGTIVSETAFMQVIVS